MLKSVVLRGSVSRGIGACVLFLHAFLFQAVATLVERMDERRHLSPEQLQTLEALATVGIPGDAVSWTDGHLSLILGQIPDVDLHCLQRFPVVELSLEGSKVADLSALADVKSLRFLNISSTSVRDLIPLRAAVLDTLIANDATNLNIDSLAGGSVRCLILSGASVTNCAFARHVGRLSELTVSHTSVSNLEPLRGLSLKHLDVSGTAVENLAPVEGMPLDSLMIENTGIVSLHPLKGMPLKHLNAAGTKIKSILPLKGMPLESLDVSRTRIVDLTPLQGMPLRVLDISGAKVKDLSAISGLSCLRILLCNNGMVRDLRPLRSLKLKYLSIRNTPIEDLSPVSDVPKIVQH